jgi:hypothetical protein
LTALDTLSRLESVDRTSVAGFLRRAIDDAVAASPSQFHCRTASPAGLPLELWFDDAELADLYVSRFATCTPVPGQRATRIYVLSRMGPLPAWTDEALDAPAFHALLREAGLRAAYPHQPQVWQALDERARVGIHLARSIRDLPLWHAGSPLRQHLHWLLRAAGKRIAHAATLGADGRGILVFGSGGAGKSGTTLSGIAAGLHTVGDDYVALGDPDSTGAPTRATPLFRIVKQDRRGLARFGNLLERAAALPENWMRKVEFDPTDVFPGCFVDQLEIRAVVLPRIAHADTPRFTQITGGEAMRVLIPTNLMQFPGEADDGMAFYADLVRRLPCYRLDLAADAQRCGEALRDFVAAL